MTRISVNYVTARPTYGAMIGLEDTHLLDPTLESLKRQTFEDFEFVCVDLLYEKRPDLFEAWDLPFPAKHLSARPDWWLEQGVWSGSAPRNKGIVAADDETEIILIVDDCCEFGPEFLQLFWDWYEKGYFAMALTLYNKGGKPLYHRGNEAVEAVGNSEAVSQGELTDAEKLDILYKRGERVQDSRWRFVEASRGTYYPPPKMYYGYSSISMEAALRVNGFDEKMDGDKSLIDVDMGVRLSQAGYHFVLDRNLMVTENSHYSVPSDVLFWDAGTLKSNYNIMNLSQEKGRWKANSYRLSEEEVNWILTHRDPLEKHIPVYPEDSRHHKLLMEWAENHQPVFELRELRFLS